MVKNLNENTVCDLCGERISAEFTTMTSTIDRKLNVCRKCAIMEGMIVEAEQDVLRSIKLITPQEIIEQLDKVVVGNYLAKKQISLEIYTHLLRLTNKKKLQAMGKRIQKNNILILGNTGCGKTLLAQAISKIVNIPFATTVSTSLSETGFSGADPETVIANLFNASDQSVKRCEIGVVFLDEVDKLSGSNEQSFNVKGVNSTGVQKSLLSIIEGSTCRIQPQGNRYHPQKPFIEIKTDDILFIAAGAFQNIEYHVRNRINNMLGTNSIGFGAARGMRNEYTPVQLRSMVTSADLRDFGMVPEFIARFPILINMQDLNESDLVSILKLPNGLIEEYQTYFSLLGKELIIDNSAIMKIATIAHRSLLGARSLRSVTKELLNDLLFDAPANPNIATYYITDKMVEQIFSDKYDNVV